MALSEKEKLELIEKVKSTQMRYYNGDTYLIEGGTFQWQNVSTLVKTKADITDYIKGMFKERYELINGTTDPETLLKKIDTEYKMFRMEHVRKQNVDQTTIKLDGVTFLNGHYRVETGKFTPFKKTEDVEFSPYQIPFSYRTDWDETNIPQLTQRFFKELSNYNEKFEQCIFEVLGTMFAPKNESIFPIFYSPHASSGKGTLMEIVGNIVETKQREVKGDKWWKEDGSFALAAVKDGLVAWVEEVPLHLTNGSSEKIKTVADSKRFLEIERKGVDQERMLNTLTWIATTNNEVKFHTVDDSIKKRVIWLEFTMNKYGKPLFTPEEVTKIATDRESIEYIIYRSMKAYSSVYGPDRKGTRNERFTLPECHFQFWERVKDHSKALEIIESSEALANLWSQRVPFIANEDFKTALITFKEKNRDERITLQGVKSDIIQYFHANKLGEAKEGRDKTGKLRGITFRWRPNKDAVMVRAPWDPSIMITKDEADKYEKTVIQEELAKERAQKESILSSAELEEIAKGGK